MGTWGPGVYDNDSATDWAGFLTEGSVLSQQPEETIARAEARDRDGYIPVNVAQMALAACDVIARLAGESSDPEPLIDRWVSSNTTVPAAGLLQRCVDLLTRIQDPARSELARLRQPGGVVAAVALQNRLVRACGGAVARPMGRGDG